MEMMTLDQAALLREMMSQLQQNEYGSVAILSTSEIENEDLFLKRMVDYYAKTTKKKTSLMGISGQGKEVKEMTMEKKSMDEIKEKQSDYVEWIPGSLHFISELRRNESLMVHFSQEMKKIEEQNEILFYYSGRGMEPTTINLSLASNKMIILMKPTKKSCIEVSKLMKIFSKIDGNNEVGIIVDTIDQEIFEEQIKKIQELCGSEFKYYMEPIGFFELNYAPLLEDEKIFEEFNFNYLNNKQNMKHFSDSILNMVM
jgi:cellulose biosynthesis protein BcsQ